MEYFSYLIHRCHSEYNKKEEIMCEINFETFFATFTHELCKCIVSIKYKIHRQICCVKISFIIFFGTNILHMIYE